MLATRSGRMALAEVFRRGAAESSLACKGAARERERERERENEREEQTERARGRERER